VLKKLAKLLDKKNPERRANTLLIIGFVFIPFICALVTITLMLTHLKG